MPKQTYFRFDFRTSVSAGAGARAFLPAHMKELGGKRWIVITDKGVVNAGVVDQVLSALDGPNDLQVVYVFDEVLQDARMSLVNKATKIAREYSADGILAVGGGSVLDTAKGVKMLLTSGFTDIAQTVPGNLGLYVGELAKRLPIPHIAIPTTAGTGAEVSPIAVFMNEEDHVKANLLHPYINADIAILDPDLTVGLPPKITAFTGFDALTHAVEGVAWANQGPMYDALGLQAIRLIDKNLATAVHAGTNIEARMNMLTASCMAIMSFPASGAIPVHNCAHALGAMYGIPHGLANAVLLPIVMEALPEIYLPKIEWIADAMGIKETGTSEQLHQRTLARIRELQAEANLPTNFLEFGPKQSELQQAMINVLNDPAGVVFKIPVERLIQILTKSLFGM
ncbi:iron-containing alcohol dehydrogenase [Alicyclobacillus herbarius]|uniref:iron-containing alcohol dehydrogenase n=1 Tax=Alicyclobacillus herbarius TaxID=122960 RepID=UPI00040AF538|nr:iron-containing alcohol dehydrogenase [Alicyclobacillus herbarius]